MSEQENNGQGPAAAGQQPQQPGTQFKVQRVYLKDLSFEAPMGVEAFRQSSQPGVEQELNTQITRIDETTHEVVLLLTVTAKSEGRTVFLVEVKQAGLFHVQGFEGMQLNQVLNTTCAQILFPYVREVIDSTLMRGTFPPLMLPPINFDAVFAQAVSQAKKKAESGQPEGSNVQ
ncbi:protein-export chaperone SecB [Marinimicrobium alkaliphilum]|uniref:protein-export chaperone SecB n=1 Tax=Marinimicrobium alkaliphilum TaxID=2202654 RepID=UPI000DB9F7DC|nr:protein-export chaperone SecB [Marinimicrobium alkaliphilum]